MITIVDYGMGNLRSVSNALRLLGAPSRISSKPEDVDSADKLILPGVGAFGAAMRELESRGLAKPVEEFAKKAKESGKPFLGICLGLQLLFDRSEEGGEVKGLGVLPGSVTRFPEPSQQNPQSRELKVPHMGWNQAKRTRSPEPHKFSDGIADGSYFYFVHSYYAEPKNATNIAMETGYGDISFPSVIESGSLVATQFHPEKSQAAGLALLKRFAAA